MTARAPVRLVVSAHGALSPVPWAALEIGDGIRLLERAVITQTPVLTLLSGAAPAPVTGPALIQLVAKRDDDDPYGVATDQERKAWKLSIGDGGLILLSSCDLDPGAEPVELAGTFAEALAGDAGAWGFAHIATHGEGSGLGQTLQLPGEPVSAARAMTLRWPAALLMASCRVGRLVNPEHAEPLNFVMAALTGGAECVVACTDDVRDLAAGHIAADIVKLVRAHGMPLDAALREVQLLWAGRNARFWAVFAAYIR